jgi:hypothetical protein
MVFFLGAALADGQGKGWAESVAREIIRDDSAAHIPQVQHPNLAFFLVTIFFKIT